MGLTQEHNVSSVDQAAPRSIATCCGDEREVMHNDPAARSQHHQAQAPFDDEVEGQETEAEGNRAKDALKGMASRS